MAIQITRPEATAGSEVLGMIRRRKYTYIPGLLLNRAIQYAEAMKGQQLERAVEELETLSTETHDEITRLRQDAKSRAISLGKQAAAHKRRIQKAHDAAQAEEAQKRQDIEDKAALRKKAKPVRAPKKTPKNPDGDPAPKEQPKAGPESKSLPGSAKEAPAPESERGDAA